MHSTLRVILTVDAGLTIGFDAPLSHRILAAYSLILFKLLFYVSMDDVKRKVVQDGFCELTPEEASVRKVPPHTPLHPSGHEC